MHMLIKEHSRTPQFWSQYCKTSCQPGSPCTFGRRDSLAIGLQPEGRGLHSQHNVSFAPPQNSGREQTTGDPHVSLVRGSVYREQCVAVCKIQVERLMRPFGVLRGFPPCTQNGKRGRWLTVAMALLSKWISPCEKQWQQYNFLNRLGLQKVVGFLFASILEKAGGRPSIFQCRPTKPFIRDKRPGNHSPLWELALSEQLLKWARHTEGMMI